MNTKGYFVIGTDTDIGKTFCSTLLYHGLRNRNAMYYKPIQSGGVLKEGKLYAPDVLSLCEFEGMEYQEEMVSYVLGPEVSPHLASELENKVLDVDKIKNHFRELCKKYDYLRFDSGVSISRDFSKQCQSRFHQSCSIDPRSFETYGNFITRYYF